MKKTIFTLLIGMIVGILIGSASGAFASIGERVEAIISEYTIIVDGEQQAMESSPVAINDSTYVPLRTMANMLGKDVTYKADSKTIEINTPVEGVEEVNLEDIIKEIDVKNNQIATSNKSIEDDQERLDKIIAELKSYGLTDDDINADEMKMQIINTIKTSIQTSSDNILRLQEQLLELESQLADLQAQQ